MKSNKWRNRRTLYFETHKRECRACHVLKEIHLHHKTYKNLGNERDADLVPLCSKCHSAIHRRQKKTKGSLWLITEKFIRDKNGIRGKAKRMGRRKIRN
jgi:5-methylcytosine-specific restriction endonuclease McrA